MINESFSLHSSHLYFASRATYTLNYFVWLFYESSGFCFLMQHRLPLRRSLSWFFIEIVKLNYSSEKRDAQQTNEIAFNSWNLWTLSNDIIAISTSHKHKSLMWRCKDSLTVYQTSFARVSHSFRFASLSIQWPTFLEVVSLWKKFILWFFDPFRRFSHWIGAYYGKNYVKVADIAWS